MRRRRADKMHEKKEAESKEIEEIEK